MQKLVKGGQEDLPSSRGAQIYPSTFLFVGLTDLDFEEQSRWQLRLLRSNPLAT